MFVIFITISIRYSWPDSVSNTRYESSRRASLPSLTFKPVIRGMAFPTQNLAIQHQLPARDEVFTDITTVFVRVAEETNAPCAPKFSKRLSKFAVTTGNNRITPV